MRIGTWNVEYGAVPAKNERRLRRMREMDCDVWVLAETHDGLDLGPTYECVATTPRPGRGPKSRWTAIWSRLPVHAKVPVEDDNRTVAAIIDTSVGGLLVFGTVLPWHTDRGPNGDSKVWAEHHRVIPIQAREWAKLRQEHPGVALCVAGDLNTNLGGPHYYGTKNGRELLRAGLKGAGLRCVTETERVPAGLLRHGPIDHICLSEHLAAHARVVGAWEGTDLEGVRLSDHSGLVVEVPV